MPEERVIQTSRSADLVTFTLLVEGQELSSQFQVKNIVVEKELNRIPWAKIIVLDGDPAAQDFPLSNQDLFVPGNEIEIKAGYHSDEETIFKGIVIKHQLKIQRAQSYLVVECRDKAVKLTVGRKSRYFYENRDSEIIEQIIEEYGIRKNIEETRVTHPELVQYNVTDWDFMIARAQANGKVCMVDDGLIEIKQPDNNQEELATISFGATLLDFDAEIDARNQFNNVTSFAWNPAGQNISEMEANIQPVISTGNLSTHSLAEVIGLENLKLKDGACLSEQILQEWANAKKQFNEFSKVRGRVKFQGIPNVKPGKKISLSGVGERFNGGVYISAIRHELTDGNWTVDAQFGLNPKWFSETNEINDVPASGLLAAVNGLQVAKVTQLADDPQGEDRILVRMPIIDMDDDGIWARIATLDAGNNRGSFFRPEIDDEVIIGFINGNPNDAIVLGMLNSSAKPAPLAATDENHEKGFFTRSQMKIVFNDDLKTMIFETPNGNKITISDDAGSIEIEDENGNKTTMNSDGITLESNADINITASGNVNISGTNVQVSANAEFKAEGSASAEVSSSGTATIQGSLVQIN